MRNKYKGEDIRARLGGTIIRYKGIPYSCIADGATLHLVDMATRAVAVKVRPDDPDLDISSMDLGYVNLISPANITVYLARAAHRRYKQGIDLAALHITVVQSKEIPRIGVHSEHLFCKGFVDSYQGKFPTFSQAFKLVTTGKAISMAISRDVAICREKDILKFFVKNEEIGWLKLGGPMVVTVPKSEISWVNTYYLDIIEGLEVKEV